MPSSHSHRGPKAPPRPPLPVEIPVYGPSPADVRAVLEGLARALPADLRLGIITVPGAAPLGPTPARVQLSAPEWDARNRRAALADCDLVLVEAGPESPSPGILVGNKEVTQDPAPLARIASGDAPGGVPVFPPDAFGLLAAFILDHLRACAAEVPLYGLVLGGGKSVRMGEDKAALAYHGVPQVRRCLDLLAPHCARSFVSCRSDQAASPAFAGLPQIHDAFLDLGPMSGILSALRAHPGAAFLVVACDLPWLDAATLAALVRGRDPLRLATAFKGPQDGLPEPLCAVFEPRAYARALQLLGQGVDCPRKLVLNSSAALLDPPDMGALRNVNDPEGYRAARAALGG